MKRRDKALLSRRQFCNEMALTTAGIVVAAQALSDDTQAKSQTVPYPPMKIEGASALLPGSSLLFSYPRPSDLSILARTDERSFYAYSQKCPHLGCSIHFSRLTNRMVCPCHKGSFDVKSGIALGGPPQRGLDEIVLQVRGNEVWAIGRRSEIDNPIAD